MPSSLYLGPARSGKTAALLKIYRDALAATPNQPGGMPSPRSGVGMGQKNMLTRQPREHATHPSQPGGMPSPQCGVGMYTALWLAPNARTASHIRGRLLGDGLSACLRPGVMTFRDLSALVIAESRKRIQLLPPLLAREMLRRVVNDALQQNELEFFAEAAARTGFIDLLTEHIHELKRSAITPDMYANAKPPRASADQHRELAHVYRIYDERLATHGLTDEEGVHWIARDLLADGSPKSLQQLELVVADGFTDFTPTQREILRLLDQQSKQLIVTLLYESDSVAGLCEAGSPGSAVADLCEAGSPGSAGVIDPSYRHDAAARPDLFAKTAATREGLVSPPLPLGEGRGEGTSRQTRHPHPALSQGERVSIQNFPPQPLPWLAIDHAVRHIFRNPAKVPPPSPEAIASLGRLEIVAAAGAHDEIAQIARRIKARLLSEEKTARGLSPFAESAEQKGTVPFIGNSFESNCNPDDIAVVFRSLTDAAPRIREVFTEFGIPFYLETELPVAAAPLVRTLQSLLRLAADDWPFRRVVGVITDNTLHAIDPAARKAADWLVRDLQIADGGNKLLHRIEQFAAIETPVDQLGDHLRHRVIAAQTALPAIQLLSTALGELPREATPFEWRDAIAKLAARLGFLLPLPVGEGRGEGALAAPPRSSLPFPEDVAAWQAIASHLAALERLDAWLGQPPRTLKLAELTKALHEVAAHGRLPRWHDEVGRVRVLSAQSARTLSVRHLFLAGMSEQSFPSPERAGRLASDADYRSFVRVNDQRRWGLSGHHRGDGRAESAEQKGTVPLNGPTRAQEEMLLFYELLSRADESLTISYPALDDKAQDLPPSPYVLELQRVFGEANQEKLRPTPPQLSPVPCGRVSPIDDSPRRRLGWKDKTPHRYEAYSPSDLRLQAVAGALDKDSDPRLLAGMFASPSVAPLAQSIDAGLKFVHARGRTDTHGPAEGIITSPAVEARLQRRFGPEHLWSPSQWESYAACPYRFFVENVLALEPLGDLTLEVDHRRRGSLAHDMLAMFHSKFRDAPLSEWSALLADDQRFDEELHHTLQKVLNSSGIPRDGIEAALLELDRREIAKWIARYRAHYEKYDGSWKNLDAPMMPAHFELRFGYARPGETSPEDASSVDRPFALDIGGETVLVTGRIDRIDVGQVGGNKVFNVIDYKSGQRPTHTREKVLSGERLQPAIYVMAAQTLLFGDDQATPLWAGYWSMKSGVTTSEKYSLRCSVETGKPTAAWSELQSAVKKRIREFVRAIRAGQFPVASPDPDCTSRCNFSTICRIGQIRSLNKQWLSEDACGLAHNKST